MKARTLVASLVATGAAVALTSTAPSAVADTAKTVPHVSGLASGSSVKLANGTVSSGNTAPSGIDTLSAGQTSSNAVAGTTVPGMVAVGAVSTSAASSAVPGGLAVLSHSRTSNVSLLGGVVTAAAVSTASRVTLSNGKTTTAINTNFADLRINGDPVTVKTDKNTKITVAGVATVTLNYQSVVTGANGGTVATGAGIVVSLLKDQLGGTLGSTITLNPVIAAGSYVGPGYAPLAGYAYATRVVVKAGKLVTVASPATGAIGMPHAGTGGKDVTNNTASVTLPGTATVGTVGSTANGIVGDDESRSTLSSSVNGINLLGGLVTADAVTATAEVDRSADGSVVPTASSQLVNLVIDGNTVPVDVAPNTVIPLAGVGSVVVNAQAHSATASADQALVVRITTASFGLPAGATIELATAVASFRA